MIDIQKQFYKISDETARSLKGAVEYTNEAIKIFRKDQLPIISIQHMDQKNGFIPGNPDFDLPDDFGITPLICIFIRRMVTPSSKPPSLEN